MQWRCLNMMFLYCLKKPVIVFRGLAYTSPELYGDGTPREDGCSIITIKCGRKGKTCSETLCQHFANTTFPPPNLRHYRIYEDGSKCEVPVLPTKKRKKE